MLSEYYMTPMPNIRSMIEVETEFGQRQPDYRSRGGSPYFMADIFNGGHIAYAMDSLKNLVANLADLMDRQLAVIVDEKFNRGLPPNLAGSGGDYALNHGFKAVQIGASAWTAEALKHTMPASVLFTVH